VSKKLEEYLEQFGHEVMLARSEESNPTKRERAQFALDFHAEAVICIHHNTALTIEDAIKFATTQLYVRGPNMFVPPAGHPGLHTIFNRVKVFNTITGEDDPKDWRHRARNVMDPYLRQGFHDVVLVECGYLDAPEHQKILNQPTYPESMARCLAEWINTKIKQRMSA
jgi:hypothetical protein